MLTFSMKEMFYFEVLFICISFLNLLYFKKTAFKVNSLGFIIE